MTFDSNENQSSNKSDSEKKRGEFLENNVFRYFTSMFDLKEMNSFIPSYKNYNFNILKIKQLSVKKIYKQLNLCSEKCESLKACHHEINKNEIIQILEKVHNEDVELKQKEQKNEEKIKMQHREILSTYLNSPNKNKVNLQNQEEQINIESPEDGLVLPDFTFFEASKKIINRKQSFDFKLYGNIYSKCSNYQIILAKEGQNSFPFSYNIKHKIFSSFNRKAVSLKTFNLTGDEFIFYRSSNKKAGAQRTRALSADINNYRSSLFKKMEKRKNVPEIIQRNPSTPTIINSVKTSSQKTQTPKLDIFLQMNKEDKSTSSSNTQGKKSKSSKTNNSSFDKIKLMKDYLKVKMSGEINCLNTQFFNEYKDKKKCFLITEILKKYDSLFVIWLDLSCNINQESDGIFQVKKDMKFEAILQEHLWEKFVFEYINRRKNQSKWEFIEEHKIIKKNSFLLLEAKNNAEIFYIIYQVDRIIATYEVFIRKFSDEKIVAILVIHNKNNVTDFNKLWIDYIELLEKKNISIIFLDIKQQKFMGYDIMNELVDFTKIIREDKEKFELKLQEQDTKLQEKDKQLNEMKKIIQLIKEGKMDINKIDIEDFNTEVTHVKNSLQKHNLDEP